MSRVASSSARITGLYSGVNKHRGRQPDVRRRSRRPSLARSGNGLEPAEIAVEEVLADHEVREAVALAGLDLAQDAVELLHRDRRSRGHVADDHPEPHQSVLAVARPDDVGRRTRSLGR